MFLFIIQNLPGNHVITFRNSVFLQLSIVPEQWRVVQLSVPTFISVTHQIFDVGMSYRINQVWLSNQPNTAHDINKLFFWFHWRWQSENQQTTDVEYNQIIWDKDHRMILKKKFQWRSTTKIFRSEYRLKFTTLRNSEIWQIFIHFIQTHRRKYRFFLSW